jgi:hypothetical protein
MSEVETQSCRELVVASVEGGVVAVAAVANFLLYHHLLCSSPYLCISLT